MDYYFSVAFYESIWRVILALLISAILIVCFGSDLSSHCRSRPISRSCSRC